MQSDSCLQCKRRRIECDAAIPQCAKCRKKGLECSGPGKQYRFVDDRRAGRDFKKQARRTILPSANNETQIVVISSDPGLPTHSSNGRHQRYVSSISERIDTEAEQQLLTLSTTHSSTSLKTQPCSTDHEIAGTRHLYALESLTPQARMLFDYCMSPLEAFVPLF